MAWCLINSAHGQLDLYFFLHGSKRCSIVLLKAFNYYGIRKLAKPWNECIEHQEDYIENICRNYCVIILSKLCIHSFHSQSSYLTAFPVLSTGYVLLFVNSNNRWTHCIQKVSYKTRFTLLTRGANFYLSEPKDCDRIRNRKGELWPGLEAERQHVN
jgi:hypothetical protein